MLDVNVEIFALSMEFPRVLRRISPTAPNIAGNLLRKLEIKADSPSIWAEQFGALTVLYPLLQAEYVKDANRNELRQVNLIHLCLLLYAFVDDRVCDGQVSLDDDEVRFVDEFRSLSLEALVQFCEDVPQFASWIKERQQKYRKGLEHSYSETRTGPTGLKCSEAFQIASTRAAYGAFAAIAILHRHDADRTNIHVARNAFDGLVTGMQWIDDLKDWRDDLQLGDENLLLTTLSIVAPNDALALLANKREDDVGSALHEFGILDAATRNATRWLELAASRQRTLGCLQLESLIRDRISDAEHLRCAVERSITSASP